MYFGRKRFWRSLVAAVGLSAGLASGALADTQTNLIGNTEGTPFKAACPPGEALAGWAYNASDRLTALGVLCQKIVDSDDGKTLVGAPPTTPEHVYGIEIQGAGSGDAIFCPDAGGIIRSLLVNLTDTQHVHSFRAECKAPHHAPSLIRPTTTNGAPAVSKSSAKCDSQTSYATGFFGTFSKSPSRGGILSLGLICYDGSSDKADNGTPPDTNDNAAPPPDIDNPPPPDADNTDMADNGDDNGDNGGLLIDMANNGVDYGPKGKTRALKDASTLYSDKGKSEIAYLDKGAKIVVLACEDQGQGWCQASKPQPGLIWGGDLK